jgi:hypothetical protein
MRNVLNNAPFVKETEHALNKFSGDDIQAKPA